MSYGSNGGVSQIVSASTPTNTTTAITFHQRSSIAGHGSA